MRKKNQVDFRNNIGPERLQNIQKHWSLLSRQKGDEGTCVLGAGYELNYEGKEYFLRHQSPYQGCISWETPKEVIKELLESIGCTKIRYEWGRVD